MRRPLRFDRVRVQITRTGKLYIALTLLVGVAAVNTANNLLYLVTAGLLALMSVSGMVAYCALRRLDLEVRTPRELYAHQQAYASLRVTNRRRLLPTFMLQVRREEDERAIFLLIPPIREVETTIPVHFARRGHQMLGEFTITSDFPFGFFHRGGRILLDDEVLVFPQPLPVRSIHSSGLPENDSGGTPSGRGVGGDFHGIRRYAAGDPPSRIYWRALSRYGALHVKEFDEEGRPPLLLTLESVPGPSLEERLGQLVTLVLRANAEGTPVGLDLPSVRLSPGGGLLHRNRLLTALALYGDGGVT
jgi:uncharacterized protein (DUF58 family)